MIRDAHINALHLDRCGWVSQREEMRRANVGGWRRVAPSSALGTFSPDGEKGRSFWFWCYRDFAPTALGRAGETRFRFIIHSRKAGGIVGLEWRLAPGLAARCELGQLERRTKAEGGGRGLVDGWMDDRSIKNVKL